MNANRRCNCRKTNLCKFKDKRFLESNIIYKSTVGIQNTYIGAASTEHISRIDNHFNTFRNLNLRSVTSLSKLMLKLRPEGRQYAINWEMIGKSRSYKIGDKFCHLSSLGLFMILKSRHKIINTRHEIDSKCQDKAKKSFLNFKPHG